MNKVTVEEKKQTVCKAIEEMNAGILERNLAGTKEIAWLKEVIGAISWFDKRSICRDYTGKLTEEQLSMEMCVYCESYTDAALLDYEWKEILHIPSAEEFLRRTIKACSRGIEFIRDISICSKPKLKALKLVYGGSFLREMDYLEGYLQNQKRYLEAVSDFLEDDASADLLPQECFDILENVCGIETLLAMIVRILGIAKFRPKELPPLAGAPGTKLM